MTDPENHQAKSEDMPENGSQPETEAPPAANPVRKWTMIVLIACIVMLTWHLFSDRITPVTNQARVHAFVVPIASEVSGTVTEVMVTQNQLVEKDEILFQVDRERYEFAVSAAEADLEAARQALTASQAGVEGAEANVESAKATELRNQQDTDRLRRIREEDPGAISERRLQSTEAGLVSASARVKVAESNVEKARQDLQIKSAQVQQATAALDGARLNLVRSSVRAPHDGLVTEVRVDRGFFAGAGAPQMTFISTDNVWVQADFTENNLGNIDPGDEVQLIFDVFPGQRFAGTVRNAGFGVQVDSAPLGSLPTIDNDRSWLRSAQRFSVIVDFEFEDPEDVLRLRVGSQVTVRVYTGNHLVFNTVGRINMWISSLLSYAY